MEKNEGLFGVGSMPLLGLSFNACRFFHSWQTDEDTGKTVYERCVHCGSRRIWQRDGGYQPVRLEYLSEA